MHYQDAHIVSGVWQEPKLPHQHLHKFSVTTLACLVQGTTTILQVWDTRYDTVDSETENWLIPHIIHHIPVHFIYCE